MTGAIEADYRLPAMDGLRAIACLIVVLLHLRGFAFGTLTFSWMTWMPSGSGVLVGVPKIGVWLFFSLSAFLLTLQLLKDLSVKRLYAYSVGRVLRIMPPFAVALVVYLLVGTTQITSWRDVWLNLSLQTSTSHFWTIPTEFVFYVFLPFIILAALASRRVLGKAGVFLTLLALAAGAAVLWPPFDTPTSSIWTGWYAINFMSGIFAAYAVSFLPLARPAVARLISVCGLVAIVGLIFFVKGGLFLDPFKGLLDKHYVFGPLWSMVIYGAYVAPPRFLTANALVSIGRWSFSIYLYHWAIGVWAGRLLPSAPAFAVALAGSLLAGYLGCRFVERPTYALRRRLKASSRSLTDAGTQQVPASARSFAP